MNISETIAPKSDQLNADDLLSGARTFTIKGVYAHAGEQPVAVDLVEFPEGRPFLPCKSMRRVMVEAWGPDAATYIGKRLTLYRDPKVKFGGLAVGGVRISAMSHLKDGKPLTVMLTESRGKRAPYVVKPLAEDQPTSPSVSAETLAELIALFDSKRIPEEARLPGVHRVIGGAVTDLECITEQEARRVIESLEARQ